MKQCGNPYLEGSLEWHAWGLGNDYAATQSDERDTPLDGRWSGDPVPHHIIERAWQLVMGDSWDTYADGDDDDRDYDDAILDAWESGYRARFI